MGLTAALATAAATVITVLASVWWRRVDQARPTWLLADGKSTWFISDGYANHTEPSAKGHIANVGTGAGHHVQTVGRGCVARLSQKTGELNRWGGYPRRWPSYEPVAPSGWEMELTVYCEPSDWDRAQVAVLWSTPSPWRAGLKRHVQVFQLSEFASRPTFLCGEEDPESGLTVEVVRPEPEGPVLSDSLMPQSPLPTGGWLRQRSQRRELLRSR